MAAVHSSFHQGAPIFLEVDLILVYGIAILAAPIMASFSRAFNTSTSVEFCAVVIQKFASV